MNNNFSLELANIKSDIEIIHDYLSDLSFTEQWFFDEHYCKKPNTHDEVLNFAYGYNELRIHQSQNITLLDSYVDRIDMLLNRVEELEIEIKESNKKTASDH